MILFSNPRRCYLLTTVVVVVVACLRFRFTKIFVIPPLDFPKIVIVLSMSTRLFHLPIVSDVDLAVFVIFRVVAVAIFVYHRDQSDGRALESAMVARLVAAVIVVADVIVVTPRMNLFPVVVDLLGAASNLNEEK